MTERRLWSLSGRFYAAIAAIEERPGEMLPRGLRVPIRNAVRSLLHAQQEAIRMAEAPPEEDCDGQCASCDDAVCVLSPMYDPEAPHDAA